MHEKIPSVNDPHIVHCRGEGRKPNEVYGEKPPKKMKKKRLGSSLLTKMVLLLLIIALLGGAGFGISTQLKKNDPDTVSSSNTDTDGEASANVITTAANTIVVNGSDIYFDNKKVSSIDELKELIYTDYTEGETYIIKDDKAIKDTYDSVKNMFLQISIPYIEE